MKTGTQLKTALIGYTGLLGSHMYRNIDIPITGVYNSSDIDTIMGRTYDLIICAAPTGNKLWANMHPQDDRASLDRLKTALQSVSLTKNGLFILVSSFDALFPDKTSYGKLRSEFEQFVAAQFPNQHLVLRLPSLYGNNVKKGFGRDIISAYPLYLSKHDYSRVASVFPDLDVYYRFDRSVNLYRYQGNQQNDALVDALIEPGLSPLNYYHSKSIFVMFNVDDLPTTIDLIVSNYFKTSDKHRFLTDVTDGTLQLNLTSNPPKYIRTVGEMAVSLSVYKPEQLDALYGDTRGVPIVDYSNIAPHKLTPLGDLVKPLSL